MMSTESRDNPVPCSQQNSKVMKRLLIQNASGRSNGGGRLDKGALRHGIVLITARNPGLSPRLCFSVYLFFYIDHKSIY